MTSPAVINNENGSKLVRKDGRMLFEEEGLHVQKIDNDADDEQDMEDLAGARTRSRSSSFYNVGVDEEGGDGDEMSQDDFDKMMEEAGRSGE